MAEIGQAFTSGRWRAKEGREEDFIAAWDRFAVWTAGAFPASGRPYLLRSEEDPREFVSFGAWPDFETVAAWRGTGEFAAFVAEARELCEEVVPGRFTLVAHSAR